MELKIVPRLSPRSHTCRLPRKVNEFCKWVSLLVPLLRRDIFINRLHHQSALHWVSGRCGCPVLLIPCGLPHNWNYETWNADVSRWRSSIWYQWGWIQLSVGVYEKLFRGGFVPVGVLFHWLIEGMWWLCPESANLEALFPLHEHEWETYATTSDSKQQLRKCMGPCRVQCSHPDDVRIPTSKCCMPCKLSLMSYRFWHTVHSETKMLVTR